MTDDKVEQYADHIYDTALDDSYYLWDDSEEIGNEDDRADYIFERILSLYNKQISKKIKTKKDEGIFGEQLYEHIYAGLT